MENRRFYQGVQNHFEVLQTPADSVERIFYLKVVPVTGLGLSLWFCSTLIYGGILGPILMLDFGGLITALISYIIMWILTIVFAYARKNSAAMITFLLASFFSGVTEAPLIMWASAMLGSVEKASMVFLVASLMGIIATAGALYIGAKYARELPRNLMWAAFFGIIMISSVESILIWTIGFNTVIFWTSLLILGLLFITILYDGMNLGVEIERSWMLAVLTVFIDIVVVIIRLFIILVQLLSDR